MSRFILGDKSSEAVDVCNWRTDASLGNDLPNKFLGVTNVADTAPAFCEMLGSPVAVFNTDIVKDTTNTRAGNNALQFVANCTAGKGFRTTLVPVRAGEMMDAIVGFQASGTSVAFSAYVVFYERDKATQVGGTTDLHRGAAAAAATKYTKRIAVQVPNTARFARIEVVITGQAAQTLTIDVVDLVTTPIGAFTGLVPIGTILAWHKSLSGVPGLPTNFVECSGQTLSDKDSPLDGVQIPDLNGAITSPSDNRFLRGATTSGTKRNHEIASHLHTLGSHTHDVGTLAVSPNPHRHGINTNNNSGNGPGQQRSNALLDTTHNTEYTSLSITGATAAAVGNTGLSTPGATGTTVPYCMDVVWIMRVK